jgi:hypothetical protein
VQWHWFSEGANPSRQLGHSSRKQFERLGRMRVEALNVKGSFSDSATVRAVTYVNAEQASKIALQEPNLHSEGEGQMSLPLGE